MNEIKPNAKALLPVAVFLILYIGGGIAFHDFYAMPACIAFLIALFVAFLQNKALGYDEKITLIAKGLADDNIITMCLIFLTAGAFSGIVRAAGGATATVNVALNFLPTSLAVVGLFFIGCFISLAMGTSVGTITVLVPFAVGISQATGYSPVLCVAASASGAMFGDNLSMISDTTIAAVRTQGCQMKDKFKANFFIVLPAVAVTAVLYYILSINSAVDPLDVLPITGTMLLQMLPYILVLVGALIGINIFIVLVAGIVSSAIIGIATGMFGIEDVFVCMGAGTTAMYDITVISIVVCCISSLVKEYGGIAYVLNFIKSRLKSKRGAQAGIAALVAGVDLATANNTIAIVMTGGLAKDISDEFGIDPKRTASILDIFASVVQGLIPYGAQLLYAAAGATALLAEGAGFSSVSLMPFMFYPMAMAVSASFYIIIKGKK